MIDRLIEQITRKCCPVCAGLDTLLEYVPQNIRPARRTQSDLSYAAECIWAYNMRLIDAVADIVPSVKIQSACYEMYGPAGVYVFQKTIELAQSRGLIAIADVKRNDIGATAKDYAQAYIGRADINGSSVPVFNADFMTVNAYLGSDGVAPFTECCKTYDKGIFILVRTSNPSASQLQDLKLADGQYVYEHMMQMVSDWGGACIGNSGFSDVGAVVGATYPEQALALRKKFPCVFFLLPGVGAQGGDVNRLIGCFDRHGRGAVINNSRQMLTAWKNEPDLGSADAPGAARQVLVNMRNTINAAFAANGITYLQEVTSDER